MSKSPLNIEESLSKEENTVKTSNKSSAAIVERVRRGRL